MVKKLADFIMKNKKFSHRYEEHWAVHVATFGPIMNPVFEDNNAARLHLVSALNHISANDFDRGIQKLEQLRKFCAAKEDETAFNFFLGLAFERCGEDDTALFFLLECVDGKPAFYLPYVMAAKIFFKKKIYRGAMDYYEKAIVWTDDNELLRSIYLNQSMSLVMMHEYQDARNKLELAKQIGKKDPMIFVTEAMLYAVEGKRKQVESVVGELKKEYVDAYEQVKCLLRTMIEGDNPHFYLMPVNEKALSEFWECFLSVEERLQDMVIDEGRNEAAYTLEEALRSVFLFQEDDVEFRIAKEDDRYIFEFSDAFSVSLEAGLRSLIAEAPEQLMKRWDFIQLH